MLSHNTAMRGGRIFVVDDETMIRMLLDDMLSDIGCTMTVEAGTINDAMVLARKADFDVAILDVNLNGYPITPVAEILERRGLPFVFATGYGERGVPEAFRAYPTLQKPFQSEALLDALQTAAPHLSGH
jgi:DNA-binding NtrC family response regulator